MIDVITAHLEELGYRPEEVGLLPSFKIVQKRRWDEVLFTHERYTIISLQLVNHILLLTFNFYGGQCKRAVDLNHPTALDQLSAFFEGERVQSGSVLNSRS